MDPGCTRVASLLVRHDRWRRRGERIFHTLPTNGARTSVACPGLACVHSLVIFRTNIESRTVGRTSGSRQRSKCGWVGLHQRVRAVNAAEAPNAITMGCEWDVCMCWDSPHCALPTRMASGQAVDARALLLVHTQTNVRRCWRMCGTPGGMQRVLLRWQRGGEATQISVSESIATHQSVVLFPVRSTIYRNPPWNLPPGAHCARTHGAAGAQPYRRRAARTYCAVPGPQTAFAHRSSGFGARANCYVCFAHSITALQAVATAGTSNLPLTVVSRSSASAASGS